MTGVPPVACIVCGAPADGRLRVALWEEEEKGRLAGKSAPVCVSCHRAFLAGRLTRVEVARRYHEARGYRPAEWIDRIDRDPLLDISCLACGVLLPVTESDVAPGALVVCPRCGARNRFADRAGPGGTVRVTAEIETALAER
jgi:hypothetical protein